MADGVIMQILAKPIQLADQVTKLADEAHSFRTECHDLKSKTERLASLLRQAARADLYERPARRITEDTQQALSKALSLISRCLGSNGIVKRMFTLIPTGAFRKTSLALDNSIGDLSWLLRASSSSSAADAHLGLPPIAQNDPILCLIWEHIAILRTGTLDARADAAANLVSLARDSERNGRLIIEEDGVGHLLRLVKEGRVEGQENAARAVGLLGRDPESVEQMVGAGVCSVFANVLKESSAMKLQATVAWAVSELAANHPKCTQDAFLQNNVVRLLVGHLAFETVEEHAKYAINPPKQTHVAATKGRESEEPGTKSYLKAMAARALWQLAKGNSGVCKSVTESKALLCFSVLLEKGAEDVRYNSAMAVMEIARVAEGDAALRHSAFKRTSPAARSVVEQLLRVIEKAADYDELLVPCITAIGCLSRTFRATEKRMVGPLVRLLEEKEGVVMREAAVALTKFACTENYLHLDHSKAIINAGGAKHLVQLVYFGEPMVKIAALVLMSYIALHVPESEELAEAQVLAVLEWASKQGYVVQDPEFDVVLGEAKARLELYQSRSSAGYR